MGAAEPAVKPANSTLGLRALTLAGRLEDPLVASGAKAVVLLFVSVECPISNTYAPRLRRLGAEFGPRGVVLRLVYPNRDESPERVKQHLKDYDLPFEAYRDPDHAVTRAAGVRVTPEAAVHVPGRGWVYHGRIDDRFVDFGRARPEPLQEELREVLTAVVTGKPVTIKPAPAIGCSIAGLP